MTQPDSSCFECGPRPQNRVGRSASSASLALLPALLVCLSCTKKAAPTPVVDAGEPGAGACTSAPDAKANCQLQEGTPVQQYLWPPGTSDWYYIDAATLPPRALLTVTAGYHAPSSPVTLLVNILGADGTTSLAEMTDPGMNGAPSIFSVVLPISQTGDYYVIVEDNLSDAQNPMGDGDDEHQYTLSYTISSDPDMSGHTFGTATPVTLNAMNQATAMGVLSTPGDVDYYSVSIPSGIVRPILYMSVDAPMFELGNETTIQYSIYDTPDAGAPPVATGSTTNPTVEQTGATAILLPQSSGTYYVTIQGEPAPAPGNPNFNYSLSFMVIPDLDVNEPNDDPTLATPIDFTGFPQPTSASQAQAITKEGRIAYIPDPDWYEVKLPAGSSNTLLYYTMTFNDSAPNNARYPPMATSFNHVALFSGLYPVADACQNNCPGDPTAVSTYCTDPVATVNGNSFFPCPYSVRYQAPNFPALQNFIGAVPIAASTSETDVYILVHIPDLGADDQAYDLSVYWEPLPPDEVSSFYDSYTTAMGINAPIESSYADVPAVSAVPTSLSFGNFQQSQQGTAAPNDAQDLAQAINDYDAVSDSHVFQVSVPVTKYSDGGSNLQDGEIDGGFLPDGGFIDKGPNWLSLSMSLQWQIPPGSPLPLTNQPIQDAGARPWDMFINFLFCDPNDNGGKCDPVAGNWHVYALGYAGGNLASWEGGPPTKVYDLDQNSGTFLSLPPECLCVEPRFVAGIVQSGNFYIQTTGVDRTSYDQATAGLSVALGPYPQVYVNGDGGSGPCPALCNFCAQGGGGDCPTVTGLPTGPGPIP